MDKVYFKETQKLNMWWLWLIMLSSTAAVMIPFLIGFNKQLIQGFDTGVIGMQVGEEKELIIEPREAYGEYNPEFVKDMPRQNFPEDQEIQPGMIFMAELQDGRQVPVRISKVSEDTITIDLNPPLAGKTLIFKVKVIEIVE